MSPLYKLALAACLLLSYGIALGQTGQELPSPAFRWKCPSADSALNFHPATTAPLLFDSIPYAGKCTKVKQLSIAPLLAQTIQCVENNESISKQYLC